MEDQLVVFELADEHCSVDIAAVEGIIKMQNITSVPHAPSLVEGVTNLRGSVLPVLDLRKRFGMPKTYQTSETRIVVIVVSDIGGLSLHHWDCQGGRAAGDPVGSEQSALNRGEC